MKTTGVRRWAAAGIGAGIALALGAGIAPVDAQLLERVRESGPRIWLDVNLGGADPVGEFGELVDDGFGVQAAGRFALDPLGIALLRVDGGFLIYGRERQAICFPPPIGCRIGADLVTTNQIAYAGVGPEVQIPGNVSPYLFGTVGFSWFGTTSELDEFDDFDDDGFFRTRNYDDFVLAGRLGGGLRVRVGGTGAGPVMVDFGVEYHRNGVAEYLRRGDILDHPDGSITLFPNRTEANLMLLRVGVSFGFGGGGNRDR